MSNKEFDKLTNDAKKELSKLYQEALKEGFPIEKLPSKGKAKKQTMRKAKSAR